MRNRKTAARFAAPLAALLVLGLTADAAFALDAWRDRRGLLLGVGLGAGVGQPTEGDADSEIGFNVRARVGGGVTRELVLDGEFQWHTESFEAGSVDVTRNLYMGMVGANYFLWKGLYVRGMGGVAHFTSEASGGGESDETGLGLGGGVGFEFFATSDLAVGVGGDYQYLFFDESDFTLINFGVNATWY